MSSRPAARPRSAPRARAHPRQRTAQAQRQVAADGAPRAQVPVDRARLTGRATVLFVVLVMLAVAYAWPLREYLQQRSELDRVQAETSQAQARVDALERQRQRWADPSYVQAQARDRLHFVLPGEVGYVTLRPDRPALPQTLPPPTPRTPLAWYDALWGTVRAADNP